MLASDVRSLLALIVLGLAGYCVDALGYYPEAAFLVFTVCPSVISTGCDLNTYRLRPLLERMVLCRPGLSPRHAHVLPRDAPSLGRGWGRGRDVDFLVKTPVPIPVYCMLTPGYLGLLDSSLLPTQPGPAASSALAMAVVF